jgi:hypothetical protein
MLTYHTATPTSSTEVCLTPTHHPSPMQTGHQAPQNTLPTTVIPRTSIWALATACEACEAKYPVATPHLSNQAHTTKPTTRDRMAPKCQREEKKGVLPLLDLKRASPLRFAADIISYPLPSISHSPTADKASSNPTVHV